MEIRLFGPLEVDDADGNRLDLGTRKQRAVVAMLALSPGRVVPLDRLIEELWAGEAPAKATATLQAYISHLRRVLEPGRRPRTPPKVLLTREPGYLLDVTPGQVDLARFAAWAEDGRRLLRGERPADAVQRLEQALELWRGEPLAEFPDLAPDWPGEVRLGALEDLLAARIALGRASVPEAESLVSANPYRERAWGLLVRALYQAGRQADALSALREVRALLSDELGIEPGPELKRLEQAVFDQSPELDASDPAPVRLAEPAPAPSSRALVAREEQVRLVEERLAAARAGRGGLLLVTGEAGIGKTSLARAAADEASARGFRVAWGRCLEDGTAPAFWPWIKAGLIPAEVPGELFDLYDQVVAELRRGPLLLVLDDLHWADASSLKLLEYVAGELARTPALVVATLRPETPPGALSREAVRLPLPPFGQAEIGDYLRRHAVDADPGELLERSGGNPFYLTELLRLPAAERHLVPPGARDVIDWRVARLPDATAAALRAAAVAGREFRLDLLAAMLEVPFEEALSRLEPALAAGLLAEGADFRFSHALVRQALDTGLGRLERARLHLRAGEYLESLPGSDPAALAGHFAAASVAGGGPRAVRYAGLAAEEAGRRHGYAEAVALWELALANLPPGDSAGRSRLLTALAQARRTVGDAEGAARAAAEALAMAQRVDDRDAQVAAASATGGLSVWMWRPYGTVDEAMVATLESLLTGTGEAERATLLGTLGVELHYGPRRAEGERHAMEAVAIARRLGRPELLARTLSNYLLASFVPGRNTERRRAAEEMATIPGLAREARLVAAVTRMSCLLRAGELAEWERELAACDRLLAEVRRPELEAMVRVCECARHTLRAEWDQAEALLARFPSLTFGSTLWGSQARRLGLVYTCRRGQGRVGEILDELVAAADRPGPSPLRPMAILAALDTGDEALAGRLLGRWGAELREDWTADFVWPVWGLIAARLGTPDPAALYDRLLPIADQLMVLGVGSTAWGSVHDVLARLATRLDRPGAAARHAARAVETHRALGLTYWEA
ncbi:BTAD domain-containing putative transcriptional regulator [Nonomuraea sediminis]|uniref:BTAD domain-containing putative transcriptional regulator n=1 Tax=Nonomuraea sediminis TaxID=2835864 RepID=UPI001BDC2E24|nr:BTAD domain-containing putative transcriptional regulator [Nonomuraea sediminis]